MQTTKTSNYEKKIELLKLLRAASKEARNLNRLISGISSSLAAGRKKAA